MKAVGVKVDQDALTTFFKAIEGKNVPQAIQEG